MAPPPDAAALLDSARWRWVTAAALVMLAAHGVWVRWELLTASPYPLGVDGYFYPIQLRSLLERGQLYYPASPLAFWLMAPLAALTDPITGAKLGAALGGAAVVWPAYALGHRLGGGRVAGLVAAVLAVSSTGSLLLSAEFVKNAFGVTFGLAALAALLAAIEGVSGSRTKGPDEGAAGASSGSRTRGAAGARWRWVGAAVALVAALLTHKMAAGLVLVLGGPPLVWMGWRRWRGQRHWLVAAAGAAGVGLVLLGALSPGRFLSAEHFALGRGLLWGSWRWDAPALAVGTFELPLDGEAWKAGVASALAAVMLGWRRGRSGRKAEPGSGSGSGSESATGSGSGSESATGSGSESATGSGSGSGSATGSASPLALSAWLLVALGVLVAWPTLAVEDPQGLGFRLRIIAFVPLALTAAIAVGVALQLLPRPAFSSSPSSSARHQRLARVALLSRAAAVAALALWLAFAPTRLDRGVVYAHPAMIAAVCALSSAVPEGATVVVSERHIAFMAVWYARITTSVRPTAGDPAHRYRLMPLAFIGERSPMARAIDAARAQPQLVAPRGLHPKHPSGLVLMPEATWRWILTQLAPKPRLYYEAWKAL